MVNEGAGRNDSQIKSNKFEFKLFSWCLSVKKFSSNVRRIVVSIVINIFLNWDKTAFAVRNETKTCNYKSTNRNIIFASVSKGWKSLE